MKKGFMFIFLYLGLVLISAEDKSGNNILPQKDHIFLFKDEVDILNKGMQDEAQKIIKKEKNIEALNKQLKELYENKREYLILQRKTATDPKFKVPDMSFKDVMTGKSFTFNNFKGRTVVFAIFEKNYKFIWEYDLLDKIVKIFPDNVSVVLGFLKADEEEIKKIIGGRKIGYVVTRADEIYDAWPDEFHYRKKNKNAYYFDLINTNFVINDDGLVAGYFSEMLNVWKREEYTIQDNIEQTIRPYFKENLKTKSVRLPLTLVESARINDIESAKAIIRNQKDIDINAFENEYAALHHAVYNNNADLVKLLVDNKADVMLKTANKYSGGTPAEIAASNANTGILKILIENIKDQDKLSDCCGEALLKAVEKNNDKTVDFLIGSISNKNKLAYYCGQAMKLAVDKNNTELVKKLISNGADVNAGAPLIISAASDEKLDITKMLVEKNAEIFTADYKGNTPYNLAKTGSQAKTLNYLENAFKKKEKEAGNLILLAKDKMDYKTILAKGFKPKLSPDFKFPTSQQGKYDCFGFAVKHIVQYKYNETVDVQKCNVEYGETWISLHEEDFAALNNLNFVSCSSTNIFFYNLIKGEPVIVNYQFFYKNGDSIRHYAVAYSFDDQGVWLADSAGNKRHRLTWEFLLEGGTDMWFATISRKK